VWHLITLTLPTRPPQCPWPQALSVTLIKQWLLITLTQPTQLPQYLPSASSPLRNA